MAESLTTEILIEQVQQGSRSALDELCNRYTMRVLAAVRIRLGANLRRKVESWDIVQNVMIDALKEVQEFDCFRTEGAFLKFLNKKVEDRICDEARHWQAKKRDLNREVSLVNRRSPGSSIPLDIPEGGSALTPSKILSLREDLSRLELAMDQLGDVSDEYREIIVAVKIEGRKYSEIAADTGKTVDAVRMQLKRAVLALTKIYKDLEARQ